MYYDNDNKAEWVVQWEADSKQMFGFVAFAMGGSAGLGCMKGEAMCVWECYQWGVGVFFDMGWDRKKV